MCMVELLYLLKLVIAIAVITNNSCLALCKFMTGGPQVHLRVEPNIQETRGKSDYQLSSQLLHMRDTIVHCIHKVSSCMGYIAELTSCSDKNRSRKAKGIISTGRV